MPETVKSLKGPSNHFVTGLKLVLRVTAGNVMTRRNTPLSKRKIIREVISKRMYKLGALRDVVRSANGTRETRGGPSIAGSTLLFYSD